MFLLLSVHCCFIYVDVSRPALRPLRVFLSALFAIVSRTVDRMIDWLIDWSIEWLRRLSQVAGLNPGRENVSVFAQRNLRSRKLVYNEILNVWSAYIRRSGVIDEINKDRKMHYKHQFLLLTIEFYYRFVVPSPPSIIVQILALIKKDFRKNPFGISLTCLIIINRFEPKYYCCQEWRFYVGARGAQPPPLQIFFQSNLGLTCLHQFILYCTI